MKQIDSVLLASMGAHSSSLCYLRKIGPLPDGSFVRQAWLDRDVTYDDGTGSAVYAARTGYQQSALVATADLGVDNAEGESFVDLSSFIVPGITQARVDAGFFDKAPFVVYEVDYNDLTPGRHHVVSGGTIGEQRIKFGQVAVLEERSLSNQAKQTIGELDSLTCRAKFGSQPIGTGGGVVEERFPCGFDAESLYVDATVEGVTESDRVFTDSSLIGSGVDYFAPGIVWWQTGDNAGQKQEIESYDDTTGTITLAYPTVSPIQLGDTVKPRPDCTKNKTGHNSCKDTFWLTDWNLHFRGEPAIPVAEAGKLMAPGAAIATNGPTGTGE